MSGALRVVDAGRLSAVRSQALYHGLAEAMVRGDDPVLAFSRPAEPYVCIGYHRRLEELELDTCATLGLPVLRRQIGGGPVYLDADQLFFALALPTADAPAGVARIYEALLTPAAVALRSLGVDAALAGGSDIVVAGRKVSGTAGGQIGEGVVVVGNLMFAFPHDVMVSVLALPDAAMRAECLALMREYVAPLPQLSEAALKPALRSAYARALAAEPRAGDLSRRERGAVERWEARLRDPGWTRGPELPPLPPRRVVKIRDGVWCRERDRGQLVGAGAR